VKTSELLATAAAAIATGTRNAYRRAQLLQQINRQLNRLLISSAWTSWSQLGTETASDSFRTSKLINKPFIT